VDNAAPAPHSGAPHGARNDLALRVFSAAVLVPLVLVVTYFGGWLFVAFWAVAAFGILWEWHNLVFPARQASFLVSGGVVIAAAAVLAGMGRFGVAAIVVLIGVAAAAATSTPGRRLWAAGGMIYATAALAGPTLLRHDAGLGFVALIFLFAVVWSCDILGYFVGRAVGGPKLWPKVSPGKTWSGAIAGTVGAVGVGAATAYAAGIPNVPAIFAVALVLSVMSQAGDLFESALKRRFAAKDTGALIPGHGGLMDRLDGFLAAALAAALIGLARQGPDMPAHGLLIW
jgi:phosphatidate cytidylyltransferase